jgi:hypothetical protein
VAARAQSIAENMLSAYNAGDYQALSRDWSGPMKLVLREEAFRTFRDENFPLTGRFKSLVEMTPIPGKTDTDPCWLRRPRQVRTARHGSFHDELSTHGKVEGVSHTSDSVSPAASQSDR